MAEGIIFGGYLLDKETFKTVFKDWYKKKGKQFNEDLQFNILDPIKKMFNGEARTSDYNAALIYKNWETITSNYFGNGAVSLISIVQVDDKGKIFKWTKNIPEREVVNKSGINVTKKQFRDMNEQMKNKQESIWAADNIQKFFQKHYEQMINTLEDYQLTRADAGRMHYLLASRHSKLNDSPFRFTGSTYNKIIFETQTQADGKRFDAFMNHVGKYNNALFEMMNNKIVAGDSLKKIPLNYHNGFNKIFSNPKQVQPWLVDSLNTASWITGGDVVVIDKNGAVIYNIQIKSTTAKYGKNFELSMKALSNFGKEIKNMIDKPEKLAELMYENLKTSSANDFKEMHETVKKEVFEMVRKNLGLT